MSAVSFDAGSGRLVLGQEGFESLVALASGHVVEDGSLASLREAGVVDGASIHPSIAPAAGVAADPVVRGSLTLQQVDHAEISGPVWVGAEATVFLLPAGDDGERQVLTTATALLPAAVARVVGLRPRPRLASEGMRLPSDMLEILLSGDADERGRVVEVVLSQVDHAGTRAFLTSLVDEPWWYWSIELSWPPAPGREGERSLHVLDTVGGMAIMAGDDGAVTLEPTTPTDLWAYLSLILPGSDDLAWSPPASAGEADGDGS